MTRAASLALAALTSLSALTRAAPAYAQSHGPSVLTAQQVEVGQPFQVKFSIPSGTVTNAKLTLPPGLQASSPRMEFQTFVNGNTGQSSQGVNLVWRVTASRPGKFKVGPPVATVEGQTVRGDTQQVEVLPQGSGRGVDPFDPLGMMGRLGGGMFPPGFFQTLPDRAPPPPEVVPEDMRVEQAPDPVAFLRATITPRRAVVGEQVTLRVYSYGSRGVYGFASSTEPSHGDFLSYNLDDQEPPHRYVTSVGGTAFVAQQVRSLALFPLRAGTLRAGDMKVGFAGNGYPNRDPNQGLLRESNLVDVIVSEPPLQGRPPSYKVGDVGDYTLSLAVDPRQIVAGDAVSVVATLSGVGNVPFKLVTPEQPGVEWLEPSVSDHVTPKDGLVQGSRTFSYVVRLNQAGAIELGDLTLPFYDPKQRAYRIARAALGAISVKPNPKQASAPPPAAEDRLASLLRLRKTLGALAPGPKPLSDNRGFWWLVLGAPLGVVLSGGGVSLANALRERLRARGQSLAAQIEQALADAARAAGSDPAATVAALERALFGALELKLGLKARAVLKSELAATLSRRGLPEPLARETSELLEDCDTLRFIGEPSGLRVDELMTRTRRLISELGAAKLTDAA